MSRRSLDDRKHAQNDEQSLEVRDLAYYDPTEATGHTSVVWGQRLRQKLGRDFL